MSNIYDLCDVLVIGAGPAGSVAAQHLASSGLKVVIVDKDEFPRNKVCTGAIADAVLEQIPIDISSVIEHTTHFTTLIYADGADNKMGIYHHVQRKRLDHLLLTSALHAGAQFVTVGSLCDINAGSKSCWVRFDDHAFCCKFLIVSDGAGSASRRQLRAPECSYAIAVATRLEARPEWQGDDEFVIDFSVVRDGYVWSNDAGRTNNFGLYLMPWHQQSSPTGLLCDFARRVGVEMEGEISAFPVPVGGNVVAFGERVLLAGDAAAAGHPICNDGISAAVYTGKQAALSIMDTFASSGLGTVHSAAGYYQKRVGQYMSNHRELLRLAENWFANPTWQSRPV